MMSEQKPRSLFVRRCLRKTSNHTYFILLSTNMMLRQLIYNSHEIMGRLDIHFVRGRRPESLHKYPLHREYARALWTDGTKIIDARPLCREKRISRFLVQSRTNSQRLTFSHNWKVRNIVHTYVPIHMHPFARTPVTHGTAHSYVCLSASCVMGRRYVHVHRVADYMIKNIEYP